MSLDTLPRKPSGGIPKHQLRDDMLVNENSSRRGPWLQSWQRWVWRHDCLPVHTLWPQDSVEKRLKATFPSHAFSKKKAVLKPGERLYTCVLCDHSTKWQSAYRHMCAKHGIVKLRKLSRKEQQRYRCAFCDYEEHDIKRLAKHIRLKHRKSSAMRSKRPSVTANSKKREMTWHKGPNNFFISKKPALKIYEVVYNYDLFAPRMDHDPSNWLWNANMSC